MARRSSLARSLAFFELHSGAFGDRGVSFVLIQIVSFSVLSFTTRLSGRSLLIPLRLLRLLDRYPHQRLWQRCLLALVRLLAGLILRFRYFR